MTMAGGSCFEFCGENCINESVHMKMMCIGLSVANEYECGTCRGKWLRHDNGYEWCVALLLANHGDSLARLVYRV